MRVIAGGFIQESNTFSKAVPTVDDFLRYYFAADEKMAEDRSARNELNGFYQAAEEEGVELLPTLYTGAVSSGRIGRQTLNELKEMMFGRIRGSLPADGVLLALHGAWSAEDEDDVAGEILADVRELVGPDVPIVITLDSHANVTRRMVDIVDALVGYHTFPHVDYQETGYKAAKLLFDRIRGRLKPIIAYRKVPMIVPAENQQTYRGPMRELWAEAEIGESDGSAVETSLFAVQPWLDVKEMGCSIVVVGEDRTRAEAEADRLASLMWDKRRAFDVRLYSVPETVSLLADGREDSSPMIVSDSADSPGAGSPGDSVHVLRQLLELNAHKRFTAMLTIVDAAAARLAVAAGEGSSVRLSLGHSVSTDSGTPLEVEGTVMTIGSGKFRFGDGFIENLEGNMGTCAVIAIGGISVVVMERAVFTGDPALYRSVGLEPLKADLVMVKSANQFRSEYEKLSNEIYILDTPGASTANLRSLVFDRVPRPIYPFDEMDD
ncbi:M81 family peptidase [Cohnella endophytica]|uniref:M81 family peptidase n=1 Tax=Cohnella endophytica TaxID=2419778 RepID=A0A494XAF0_9BACL|nr:M81 family metallopeptidase [Cohnella endophytica]RKP45426.1 M81 family peptidase [Cohnella endophytica]